MVPARSPAAAERTPPPSRAPGRAGAGDRPPSACLVSRSSPACSARPTTSRNPAMRAACQRRPGPALARSGRMTVLALVVAALLVGVVLVGVGDRLRLPWPVLLVLVGAAAAFVPGVDAPDLEPELILPLF